MSVVLVIVHVLLLPHLAFITTNVQCTNDWYYLLVVSVQTVVYLWTFGALYLEPVDAIPIQYSGLREICMDCGKPRDPAHNMNKNINGKSMYRTDIIVPL